MPERLTSFLKRNERRLALFAFLAGFVWDNLTLTRIDLLYDNIVLASYLTFAGACVLFLRRLESKGEGARPKLHATLVLALQFAFGGLFSGLLVFYSRSGAFMESWPFIALLAGLLLGNEFLRQRYLRHAFRVSIFYFVLFSYLILILPVVTGKMGMYVFMGSGVLSLILIRLFLKLSWKMSGKNAKSSKITGFAVLTIFALVNWLYFTDQIPPIPLSMKEAGVYHSIERIGSEYHVVDEKKSWVQHLPFRREVYHRAPGEPVYVFSAIFAPTKLSTSIAHIWKQYDSRRDEWITSSNIPFLISGGRDGGYRGYTMKQQMDDGLWRVDVVTDEGKVIGRIEFEVMSVPERVEVVKRIQ
jgi:hypothetical protein